MTVRQSLLSRLKEFKQLLEKEKNALVSNDGQQVAEIVKQKETFANFLETVQEEPIDREAIREVAKEIQTLQETNLLLTKQAMSFSAAFLDAVQTSIQKESMTYSKSGAYKSNKQTVFLDQSL